MEKAWKSDGLSNPDSANHWLNGVQLISLSFSFYLFFPSFQSSPDDMFTDLRDSGRERKSVVTHVDLEPRCVSWPGIKPSTFWCMGQQSNQTIQPGLSFSFLIHTMAKIILPTSQQNTWHIHYKALNEWELVLLIMFI